MAVVAVGAPEFDGVAIADEIFGAGADLAASGGEFATGASGDLASAENGRLRWRQCRGGRGSNRWSLGPEMAMGFFGCARG
jgi:hypothetical protein